ncbi:MFS transporter [Lapillicoccus sp.]|uniref:MFS transporter n=1 Tax=Lapillicoccus sp. TaxID=1909287 RepID=UPI0025FC06F6|nr:MFS transporter [Lapillicoccus sp.]
MTSTAALTPPHLLSRDTGPLVVGAVALVTLGAIENRAVSTVLPTMLGELGALQGFGLVMAAPLATYLVALAVSGWWCDRSGPVPTLRIGAVLFLGAQILVGTATGLGSVVAGRLLSGLAEGMLDISLMVLVARALDPTLRPRVMALFAAAWILPSVVGPILSGVVAETVGWRWVFLGAVVLLAPTWVLLRPAMATPDLDRRDDEAAVTDGGRLRRILPWAVVGAAGLVVLNLAAEGSMPRALVAGLVVAGGVAVVAAARVLLPVGSLRASCGIGGIIALRGLLSAAFLGIGGFLPLILTTLHHQPPTVAGISLSVTGVMWSLGSAIASRLAEHPGLLLHMGFGALSLGLAGASLLVWTSLPIGFGLAGWGVAGLGIGLTSSTLSVLTMTVSDDTNQGRHNAGGQMAASMASALFYAGAGAVLAVLGTSGRLGFEVVTSAAVVLALLGLAGARRAVCTVA